MQPAPLLRERTCRLAGPAEEVHGAGGRAVCSPAPAPPPRARSRPHAWAPRLPTTPQPPPPPPPRFSNRAWECRLGHDLRGLTSGVGALFLVSALCFLLLTWMAFHQLGARPYKDWRVRVRP